MNNIDQLMRAANPVADSHASLSDDEFAALLLLTQARSEDMDLKELTVPVEPERKKYSGWLIAAAVAIVVMVLGAAAFLLSPDESLEPAASTSATSTSVATTSSTTTVPEPTVSARQAATIEALETAWNGGNEESFRALFAAGAYLAYADDPYPFTDVDLIVSWALARQSMGVVVSIDDCVPADETVRCTAEFDGPVIIAMDFVPLRDVYSFTFEDDLIASIDAVCQICGSGDNEYNMGQWVRTQAPGATPLSLPSHTRVRTPDDVAYYLEWAIKWQEAGRP